jgi:hypothetical protein
VAVLVVAIHSVAVMAVVVVALVVQTQPQLPAVQAQRIKALQVAAHKARQITVQALAVAVQAASAHQ